MSQTAAAQRPVQHRTVARGDFKAQNPSAPEHTVQIHTRSQTQTPPALQRAPAGNFNNREVLVLSTVPTSDRARGQLGLRLAGAALALGGAAALYVRATNGPRFDDPQSYAYDFGWRSLAQGAAGAIGGGVLPRVLSWGVDLVRRGVETCKMTEPRRTPEARLDAIVADSIQAGPLTLGGFKARVELLKTVQCKFPVTINDERLATAIAQLAAAIPTARACLPCGNATISQLKVLTRALSSLCEDTGFTTDMLRAALEKLAAELPEIADAGQARLVAQTLMQAYADRLPREGKDDAGTPTLGSRPALVANLRQAACFAAHPDAVTRAGESELGCTPEAYAAAAVAPAVQDSKGRPSRELIAEFLAVDWNAQTDKTHNDALDELVITLSRRDDAVDAIHSGEPTLAQYLNEHPAADSTPRRAAVNRALFTLGYLFDPEAERTRSAPDWVGASHGYLEACDAARRSAELQVGSQKAIDAGHLQTVDVTTIRAEVANALAVAARASKPLASARLLVQIVRSLSARTDLEAGAFMEGLMSPEQVIALIQKVRQAPDTRRASEAIARLPKLCQMRATPAVLDAASAAFAAIAPGNAAALNAKARAKVNERIAPVPVGAPRTLGHPWLSTTASASDAVQVHVRAPAVAGSRPTAASPAQQAPSV